MFTYHKELCILRVPHPDNFLLTLGNDLLSSGFHFFIF